MEFYIYYASDYSKLKPGTDVSENVLILGFSPLFFIECPSYKELSGTVIVKESTQKYVVLEFKNYKFEKYTSSRSQKYKLDGIVKFVDYNA